MKHNLFIALFFISSSALACPQLQGTWKCVSEVSDDIDLGINQEGLNYAFTATFGLSEINVTADGKIQTEKIENVTKTIQAQCLQNGSLEIIQTESMTTPITLESKITTVFELKNLNQLVQTTTSQAKSQNNPAHKEVSISRCQRLGLL